MKKTFCLALILALLAGCAPFAPALAEGTPRVVCTIFPLYDWARAVAGQEAIELTLLLDNGVDLHSFQPTAQDIMEIAGCDLFIYVGGESDAWVEDALKEAVNPNQAALSLLDAMEDPMEEEAVEGMQAGEACAPEETEYDEHIWLSLRNARALTATIADAFSQLDPAHADAYRANAEAYAARLAALDDAYAEAVAGARIHTMLFGDRFPFRYLAEDYGLSCYAAFSGCSAETEASFETIVFLAGKVDELGLPAVLTIENSDRRVAETIAQAAQGSPAVLTLDSMQATTARDIESGATYLGIMEDNLSVLRKALN